MNEVASLRLLSLILLEVTRVATNDWLVFTIIWQKRLIDIVSWFFKPLFKCFLVFREREVGLILSEVHLFLQMMRSVLFAAVICNNFFLFRHFVVFAFDEFFSSGATYLTLNCRLLHCSIFQILSTLFVKGSSCWQFRPLLTHWFYDCFAE